MTTRRATAIAVDMAQARVLAASVDNTVDVVVFSPDVELFLCSNGFECISAESLLSTFSYARNVVLLRRLIDRLRSQLEELPFHASEVQAFTVYLFNLLGPALLLRSVLRTIGDGPIVIVRDGRAETVAGKRSALRALAGEIRPDLRQFTSIDYSKFHGRLAQSLSRVIAAATRGRPTVTHIDFGNPVPRRLVSLLEKEKPDLLVTYARPPRHTMLDTLVRGVRSLINNARRNPRAEVHIFRAASDARRSDVPEDVFDAVGTGNPELDDLIRDAMRAVAPLVRVETYAGASYAQIHDRTLQYLIISFFPQRSVLRWIWRRPAQRSF